MRVDLYYNFNEYYNLDKKESIKVVEKDFKYTVYLNNDELNETVELIYNKYKEEALKEASFKYLDEYGYILSK